MVSERAAKTDESGPVVARNLGHADTRMVAKHYGHLAPGFVADAIRKHAPRYGLAQKSNVKPMGRAAL
jgi:hypothetical protein